MSCEIVEGDSMRVMSKLYLDGQQFDMIFLDPPFFDWARTAPIGKEMPDHNLLSQLVTKLLKQNGTAWLCGTQPNLIEVWPYWKRWFKFNCEIIWAKPTGTMAIAPEKPLPCHENIWCIYKDKIDDTKLNFRTKIGHHYQRKGLVDDLREDNRVDDFTAMKTRTAPKEWHIGVDYMKSVFNHPQIKETSKEYYGHPTQKPLKLLEDIVKVSTNEQDWILDPFSGSGTTLIACKRLNRNGLGIEINPEYVNMIKKRLELECQLKKLESYISGS